MKGAQRLGENGCLSRFRGERDEAVANLRVSHLPPRAGWEEKHPTRKL